MPGIKADIIMYKHIMFRIVFFTKNIKMNRNIIKRPNSGPDAPNLVSGKLYWIYSPKVGK